MKSHRKHCGSLVPLRDRVLCPSFLGHSKGANIRISHTGYVQHRFTEIPLDIWIIQASSVFCVRRFKTSQEYCCCFRTLVRNSNLTAHGTSFVKTARSSAFTWEEHRETAKVWKAVAFVSAPCNKLLSFNP